MHTIYHLVLTICILCAHSCRISNVNIHPDLHEIPDTYVYCVTEHNDSIYYSTQKGTTCCFAPAEPNTVIRLGNDNFFHPLRTITFSRNDRLYASSYESGVYMVMADTFIAIPNIWRKAWSMKLDSFDNIWLAGRQGVFKQYGDSLMKITTLNEAYDIDFYMGELVVAHREGITFFDSTTGAPDTTFCKGTVCWALDVFDSLLVVGGVEICALLKNRHCTTIPLTPTYTIPWAAACNKKRIVYLATQKGLYMIDTKKNSARCIGYEGKCIKSLYIDKKDRLWVGTYFKK